MPLPFWAWVSMSNKEGIGSLLREILVGEPSSFPRSIEAAFPPAVGQAKRQYAYSMNTGSIEPPQRVW